MKTRDALRLKRRDLLRFGSAILIGGVAGRPRLAFGQHHLSCPLTPETSACFPGEDLFVEFYPTSPFILEPFKDELPIPQPLRPVSIGELMQGGLGEPGPGAGQQASDGQALSTHSIWPTTLGLPDPRTNNRLYRINLKIAQHFFTSSKVLPIDANGNNVIGPDGSRAARNLPPSTIWGFNGTFPGPMINAEYGKPNLVRFVNLLHQDNGFDSGDFGSPCRQFLTHLHNAHTAPESDGNPHFRLHGYFPEEWVDNLYLNYPPGNSDTERDKEKQSFLWFHDHFEGYTASQVYKGLVGLYPIYDPILDSGDETKGLRLPGVRRDNSDGTFAVDYDIPLAIFDCRFDDCDTPHLDFHNGCGQRADAKQWGTAFFRHFPNHGFVGDVFTVNGKVSPYLKVKRRKYRFRFLDASISRVYDFKLMSSTSPPKAAPGTQGQWLLPDGEQCMRFTQIASEGGLLPFPVVRNSFRIWPAKRREVVVDFSKYMDGTPTRNGEVVYLVNITQMEDGRMPDSSDPRYKVPILKFIIDGDATDNSMIPNVLRPLPDLKPAVRHRTFELQRGGISGNVFDELDPEMQELSKEFEWLINGKPFIPDKPLVFLTKGEPEIWTIKSGGGWGHPLHFHQEEHQILSRNGVQIPRSGPVTDEELGDDIGKEDTVALNGSEEVVLYRNFRTFPAAGLREAPYVAHCHNLAHEDHSMMFGWSITV